MTSPATLTWLDAFFTSPVSAPNAAAATLVLTSTSPTWSLIQPNEVVTLPLLMAPGLVYLFTTSGVGFSSGSPVTFQRPSGATYLIQNPQDPNNTGGGHAPAASVQGTQENRTYGLVFDGASTVRIVS